MNGVARRMFELVEPIGVIPYTADEPNEAMILATGRRRSLRNHVFNPVPTLPS
jgi:hypothetical protein